MHVGQDGASRLQSLNPFQRLAKGKMAWMRTVLQRIDDQHIEVLQLFEGFVGVAADIAAVGDATNAKAERCDVAVELFEGQEGERAPLPLRS